MGRVHRFRPRYRGMAWGSIGTGGVLAGAAVALGFATLPFVAGAIGMSLGLLYLGSPTWRLRVTTDDDGLEVSGKFRLAWRDVVRVVTAGATAFVDGGTPERSLLVPGDGAPAPYWIEDAPALVATILAHVTPDRIERVESLDRATRDERRA